jgi:cytochrome P450
MVFYNPMEPSYVRDPYPMLKRMREEDPVHFFAPAGGWFLTRYADIWSLMRDPRALSLPADQMSIGGGKAQREGPFQRAMRKWLVLLDPPDHTRLRNLLNKSFTPKVIARLGTSVLEIADELLDAALQKRDVDLMRDYTNPLPLLVIAGQLGIPREDRTRFKLWSDAIANAMDPIYGYAHREAGDRATLEMFAYLREIAEDRKSSPREDLLSLMISAEEAGDRLSMDELLANSMLLLFAGNETTTGLLGNAVVALLENRDEEALLRARPELMPSAIEEFLRYETPTHTTGRVLASDMEIGGKQVPKGARVICILGAANRDPEAFEDPDILDVQREDNKHLAFGTGHHFCLGNHLARLEARVALGRLLERTKHFELTERHIQWRATVALRGPKALPMRLTPV